MVWIAGIILAYAFWRTALAWAVYRLDQRAAGRGWPSDYDALNAYYRLEVGEENASPEILAAGDALELLEESQREAASNDGPDNDFFEKLDELRARRDAGEIDEGTFEREYSVLNADFDAGMEKMKAELEESRKRLEGFRAAIKAKDNDAIESYFDEVERPVDYLNDDIPADAHPLPEEWRIGICDELEKHAHILPHFDLAAEIGTARYPIDFTNWPDSCGSFFDAWSPLKSGARLLQRTAILRAEAGDTDGAVQALEKLFRLAQTLERQPTVMSQMVWMALVSSGLRAMPHLLSRCRLESNHLATLEAALDRVSSHDAYTVAWAGERCILRPAFHLKTLRTEGPAEIALKDEPASDTDGQSSGDEEELRLFSSDSAEEPVRWYEWLFFEIPYKLAGLETLDCLQFMGEIEAGLRVANYAPAQKRDWIRKRASREPRFRLPLIGSKNNIMVKPMSHLATTFAMQSRIANARGALVVERFRWLNGTYPASAAEIAEKMPLDIYSGEPMRYRASDDGYVVFSVGSNGKDDGGPPVTRRGGRDNSFRVRWP